MIFIFLCLSAFLCCREAKIFPSLLWGVKIWPKLLWLVCTVTGLQVQRRVVNTAFQLGKDALMGWLRLFQCLWKDHRNIEMLVCRDNLTQASHGSGKIPRMRTLWVNPFHHFHGKDIPWLQPVPTSSCPFIVALWLCPHYNHALSSMYCSQIFPQPPLHQGKLGSLAVPEIHCQRGGANTIESWHPSKTTTSKMMQIPHDFLMFMLFSEICLHFS